MELKQDIERVFKHAKVIFWIMATILLLIYFATGFYSVKPEQRGVVKRFGHIIDDNIPPGIHYHWPWPVESVSRPKITEIQSVKIMFEDTSNTGKVEKGGALLTGDENLVLISISAQYTIKSAKLYLSTTKDPKTMLSRLVQSSFVESFAKMSVDEVMTTGRQQVQQEVEKHVQKLADKYSLGINIKRVQIQKVEPPAAVAQSFKDVASAREDKHKALQKAEGDRNRRLPGARAKAEATIRMGNTQAKEAVEKAVGDSERFLSTWNQYKHSRSVTAHRLYLESMELILRNVNKVFTNPDAEKNVTGRNFR